VTVEPLPVVAGSVAVPDGPGLGVTLDREKLTRYERAPRPQPERFLIRVQYDGGLRIYFRCAPEVQPFNGASNHVRFLAQAPGPPPGYANPVTSDFWAEPGSPEFERIWRLTESRPYWVTAS
jgi:hypothetical protein